MSPNPAVKSDSWLDLTADSCHAYKQQLQLERVIAGAPRLDREGQWRQREPVKSVSGCTNSNQFRRPKPLDRSTSGLSLPAINSSSSNNSNQHLLIRLRQQSYLSQRSSQASSQLSSLASSLHLCGRVNEGQVNEPEVSEQKTSFSRRENLKLSQLRRRLSRAPTPRARPQASCDRFNLQFESYEGGEEKSRNSSKKKISKLNRSWSSLSEKLNGKLSDFRHSWKHFLYQYQQGIQQSQVVTPVDADRRTKSAVNSNSAADLSRASWCDQFDNFATMDKCQLTRDWLDRHCAQDDRPKSLRLEHRRSDISSNIGQTQNIIHLQCHQSTSSSSSATLVSGRAADLLEESSNQHSVKNMQQAQQPATDRQTSETLALANNQLEINQNNSWLMKVPTSDYWSTMASNSELYKQQQVVQQQQQLFVPIGADQEYYLDVAAANNQQQPIDNIVPATAPSPRPILVAPAELEDYADEDYAVPADESCRLDRSQVELVQLIGEGQKGYVFLGKLQSKDGSQIMDVAIKTLKYETGQLIEKLMREAAMMRQLEHPHIIRFIGVCPETPALIAMELAQFGEVKRYFKLNGHIVTVAQLILFTFQISTALSYLESKNYVHRDVAARNVLVCSHNCVKLADFGLSRNLQPMLGNSTSQQIFQQQQMLLAPVDLDSSNHSEESQYVAAPRVKLPIRWLAPESLVFRRFTSASDVWMFAVCSWELFHLCQARPWADIRNHQVLAAIEAGQRLPRPPSCPARLYQLMLQCWSYAPVQRPKFREMKQCIWSIYLNERAKQQLELEHHQQQQQQQQLRSNVSVQAKNDVRLANNRRLVLLDASVQQQDPLSNCPPSQQMTKLEQFRRQANSQAPQRQQKPRQVVSPIIINYPPPQPISQPTNIGGYSSATPTATEVSANSSRSSSMGSLARQQAIKNRLLQHPVVRRPSRSDEQAAARQNQKIISNNSSGNLSTKTNSPTRSPSSGRLQLSPAKEVVQERLKTPINKEAEANARRFRRTPGHMLQKQRSQGSIGLTSGASERERSNMTRQQGEDEWGRNRYLRSSNGMLPQFVDNEDDVDGDDEDNSSESELELLDPQRKMVKRPSDSNKNNNKNNRLATSNVIDLSDRLTGKLHLEEPDYEGVRREPSHKLIEAHPASSQGKQFWRPASWRAERADSPVAKQVKEQRNHNKFGHLLQSLGMVPMKAKLAPSAAAKHQMRQSSVGPDIRPANRSVSRSLTTPSTIVEGSGRSSAGDRLLAPQDNDGEEQRQRQLAAHQRLLGRVIRPASVASNRRSMNFQGENSDQQQARVVSTVDQSLQLLESLMSEEDELSYSEATQCNQQGKHLKGARRR